MRTIFWLGFLGLLLFEIANVYFIMPMPGSQKMNSIDLAYFLYTWRWAFRIIFGIMIVVGMVQMNMRRKWLLAIPVLILAAVAYMTNFVMAADSMFKQPKVLHLTDAAKNKIDSNRLIIGVSHNGESKAYPINLIGYHHQVQDTLGGKPIIVTYCTVCRTGRVFEPVVNGHYEKFRLVGMDHFNAMFEDETTGSWWRQVNGEAITGKLKGQKLPEVLSTQTSLAQWLKEHPRSWVMQEDKNFSASYDSSFNYESGKSKKDLTGTDSLSWNDKSWVVGVKNGKQTKAYDWNQLKQQRAIVDTVLQPAVAVVLGKDEKSFYAFEIPAKVNLTLSNDTILLNNRKFTLSGSGIDTIYELKRVPAYQEFWHSWKTFNPSTLK